MNEETGRTSNISFRRRKFNKQVKKGSNGPKAFAHDSTMGIKGTSAELDGFMLLIPSEIKVARQD